MFCSFSIDFDMSLRSLMQITNSIRNPRTLERRFKSTKFEKMPALLGETPQRK
jgi:hypothetical protein